MMKTINAVLALSVLGFIWAHPASAGRQDFSPALILLDLNGGAASGSLGSTRNDWLDPNQYIGCESNVDPAGRDAGTNPFWNGSCSARKFGVQVSCRFPELAQILYQDVASNIASDSFVSFSWDNSTGECNSLYIYTDSFDEPKLP